LSHPGDGGIHPHFPFKTITSRKSIAVRCYALELNGSTLPLMAQKVFGFGLKHSNGHVRIEGAIIPVDFS